MLDFADLESLRPCGRYETYSTAKHHLGFHKSIGVTATYHSSIKLTTPQESLIFGVLHELIAKHPVLSAVAINEEKSYPDVHLMRLPEIDLRTCVEFVQRGDPFPADGVVDEEFDILLTKQHDRNFKDGFGSKPCWRLIIVSSSTEPQVFSASWFFHHVISDGLSAMVFHESFLRALNSEGTKTLSSPIVPSSSTPLLPPFESLHPMPISWSFFLRSICAAILPSIFARRPTNLWTGNPLPEQISALQGPRYRTLVFSAEITKKLAQISRRENTSVTGALQCLLAASLFTYLPVAKYDTLKIVGPISMRRFLPGISEDTMTNATSVYECYHQRSAAQYSSVGGEAIVLQQCSWETARSVKSTIQLEVAKEGGDNPIALLKYVPNMHKFLTNNLGQPRNPSVQFTNIGVCRKKAESPGPWTVGRMVYSTDAFGGAAVAASVVTGGDGNATIGFCWMRDALEASLIDEVIKGIEEGVKKIVSEDLTG